MRQVPILATANQASISLGHSVPGLGTLQALAMFVCRLHNMLLIGMHMHMCVEYTLDRYLHRNVKWHMH